MHWRPSATARTLVGLLAAWAALSVTARGAPDLAANQVQTQQPLPENGDERRRSEAVRQALSRALSEQKRRTECAAARTVPSERVDDPGIRRQPPNDPKPSSRTMPAMPACRPALPTQIR